MSRFVLGALALIAAGWTMSARAADLYGSRAPYTVNQPLNAYSWAGPYLGGNLGYAWGSVANNPTKPSGFVGGVQAGYNWQNGAFVFGVEGDIQATGPAVGVERLVDGIGCARSVEVGGPCRHGPACSDQRQRAQHKPAHHATPRHCRDHAGERPVWLRNSTFFL